MLDAKAPLEIIEEIDSTIVEARRRAESGDLGPVWLMARRQSAGRGRRGRAWASIDGNLFATYLGQTRHPPAQIALLGFAAGLAIAEAADVLIEAGRARLKWPNDLMIEGAKAAGIMLDSGAVVGDAHPGRTWFALAFGVNIIGAPGQLDQPTQYLSAFLRGPAPSPEALLGDIRVRLETWAQSLERRGFAALRAAWLARAYGLGRTVRIEVGGRKAEGVVAGLSENGELELETVEGLMRISAGDVHFPELAAV